MPRATTAQRQARDALVFDQWVAGDSLRDIGAHPDVQLSPRAVQLALDRYLAAVDAERLAELWATAYAGACAGDPLACQQMARLQTALSRHAQLAEAAAAAAVVVVPRRQATLMASRHLGREGVLRLAQEQAAVLAETKVLDVRLDGSQAHGNQVEWKYSFEMDG